MPIDFAKLDLRDALDLAILMEEEARQRYVDFSKLVGGRYPGDAAETFALMASYEEKHGTQLASRLIAPGRASKRVEGVPRGPQDGP